MSTDVGPDAEYVAAVHREDETGFSKFVREYVISLTRYAYSIVGDEDTAHDIVQDVFARVWQLGREWNPGSVSVYLHGAIRNRSLDVLRSTQAQHRLREAIALQANANAEYGDGYVDVALVQRIREEIQHLSERQRDVIRLRYGQGYSMPQVAMLLGVKLRAAERLVARALETLRRKMDMPDRP